MPFTKIETSGKAHMESKDSGSSGPEVSVEASGGTHVESEDSRSRLPEASEQSIAQASGESNAIEAAIPVTTLKRLIEQVSSALPNRHMRLKNFVQFS